MHLMYLKQRKKKGLLKQSSIMLILLVFFCKRTSQRTLSRIYEDYKTQNLHAFKIQKGYFFSFLTFLITFISLLFPLDMALPPEIHPHSSTPFPDVFLLPSDHSDSSLAANHRLKIGLWVSSFFWNNVLFLGEDLCS